MTLYFEDPATLPPRSLEVMRRQRYEARRQEILEARAKRKRNGAPPEDVSAWTRIREAVKAAGVAAAAAEPDSAEVSRHLAEAAAQMAPIPEELSPFQARPELEDIQVRFRVLSSAELIRLNAPLTTDRPEEVSTVDWVAQNMDAAHAFIRRAVAWVGGLRNADGPVDLGDPEGARELTDRELLILDRVDLVMELYHLAQEWNALPFESAARFGVSPPPTSPAGSVAPAPPRSGPASGAPNQTPAARG